MRPRIFSTRDDPMEQQTGCAHCSLASLPAMAVGTAESPSATVVRRLKLWIRRRLSPSAERRFKQTTNHWANRLCAWTGQEVKPIVPVEALPKLNLAAGERVRVRSLAEIESTLNHWHQLKGCTFMPEMAQYCGTEQRVLKPLQRFVDERDLRVKKAAGVVLLENAICQGTAAFGHCDRSCFLFWREEWLERKAAAVPLESQSQT